MDEQEKELEEILRMFDKAPSPSSERNNQAQMRQNNLQSRQISQKPIDAERTARTSNQTAYICIPNTAVNYPVMFTPEEPQKYLRKNFEGEYSVSGVPFLDGASTPECDNLIIYGHNMKNDEMFGSLKYYERNYDYYEAHPLIYLNSNYETYTYKIFAYFIVDAEDETETKFDCWNYLNFNSEEEFYDYVNEAKRRTLRLTNVDVKYGDPLLTLSTCNTILGDRGRLIVMARLVRDGEDPLEGTTGSVENNNIKWPSLYYNSKPNAKYDPDAEFVPYGPASETQTAETTETSNTEE